MMPSSMTRLVEANRKARLGMSAAPFLKSIRLIAAEAYEQLEEAAPASDASAICVTPSLPRASRMRSLETTA